MKWSHDWFRVDKEGLAQLLADRGPERLIYELISNAWDEAGVTEVVVELEALPGRPFAKLVVRDDAPDGFQDLREAYTLFAPSRKKGNADQRGRFNLGEKLVLACCKQALIASTTGSIQFSPDGIKQLKERREAGTEFSAVLPMTRAQLEGACEAMHLISPQGILTTLRVDGVALGTWEAVDPERAFQTTLPTVLEDETGSLRRTQRQTQVELYESDVPEGGWLYELGIPVVNIGGPFHVNVMQKVPLNMDRDNVTPAYLKKLRAEVLNHAASLLSEEAAAEQWVADGIEHRDIQPETTSTVITKRFGEDAVAYDPSDREGSNLAASQGRAVIHGGALSGPAWANVRAAGVLKPAGQVTPSNASVAFCAEGEDVSIDPSKWKGAAPAIVQKLGDLAAALLDQFVAVHLVNDPRSYNACYAAGSPLVFNVRRLSWAWFGESGILEEKHLDLLLHELGHHYAEDHLSEEYHKALTRLGAKLALLDLP